MVATFAATYTPPQKLSPKRARLVDPPLRAIPITAADMTFHMTSAGIKFTLRYQLHLRDPEIISPVETTLTLPVDTNTLVNGMKITLPGKPPLHAIIKPALEAKKIFNRAVRQQQTTALASRGQGHVQLKINVPPLETMEVEINGFLKTPMQNATVASNWMNYQLKIPSSWTPRFHCVTISIEDAMLSFNSSSASSTSLPASTPATEPDDVSRLIRSLAYCTLDLGDSTSPPASTAYNYPIKISMFLEQYQHSVHPVQCSHPIVISAPDPATTLVQYSGWPLKSDLQLDYAWPSLGKSTCLAEYTPDSCYLLASMQIPLSNHETTEMNEEPVKLNHPVFHFLLDNSGSMTTKMPQVKTAASGCLSLIPNDSFFNIHTFTSTSKSLWLKPRPYNNDTLLQAKAFIEETEPKDSTVLFPLIESIIREQHDPCRPRFLVVITDGVVENFADGILNLKTLMNQHPTTVISVIGLGSEIDHDQCQELAQAGFGPFKSISHESQLTEEISGLMLRARQSNWRNVKVSFFHDQIPVDPQTTRQFPRQIRSLFPGDRFNVLCSLPRPSTEIKTLRAVFTGQETDLSTGHEVTVSHSIEIPMSEMRNANWTISQLHAHTWIQVMEQADKNDYKFDDTCVLRPPGTTNWKESIQQVALQHHQLSSQTSLVLTADEKDLNSTGTVVDVTIDDNSGARGAIPGAKGGHFSRDLSFCDEEEEEDGDGDEDAAAPPASSKRMLESYELERPAIVYRDIHSGATPLISAPAQTGVNFDPTPKPCEFIPRLMNLAGSHGNIPLNQKLIMLVSTHPAFTAKFPHMDEKMICKWLSDQVNAQYPPPSTAQSLNNEVLGTLLGLWMLQKCYQPQIQMWLLLKEKSLMFFNSQGLDQQGVMKMISSW